MDIRPAICYMMEALSYLGMKANNVDFDERLSKALKSAGGSERARHFLSASRTMYDLLDSAVRVDERELKACFGFFSGMPDGHPYGYNIAAMLCGDADLPVREIVREINRPEYRIELQGGSRPQNAGGKMRRGIMDGVL